jgi:hypothetical protein
MRAKDFIIEAGNLATGEIKKYNSRIQTFLNKIKNKSPFETQDGKQFIADPTQYDEIAQFLSNPNAKGAIKLRSLDGTSTISTSGLVKTAEFGGQSVGQSADKPTDVSQAGKEGLPIKPPQVFNTTDIKDINLANAKDLQQAGAFRVNELYSKIANSQQLQSLGEYGQAIIDCAKQIESGRDPQVPAGLSSPQMRALVDYAGEYLGILAMYKGTAEFPKRDAFLKFIGGDFGTSMLYFPKSSNNPLADSFAVQDTTTGHTLYLSSKGQGGGAAPAISGLKVPEELRKRRQYADAIKFIDLCQTTGSIEQPFQLLNWINSKYPDAVDPKFKPMLPWNIAQVTTAVNTSRKDKSAQTKLPQEYQEFVDTFTFRRALAAETTAGGILHYVTVKEVQRIVNSGIIDNFQACVLEILSENFVQVYTEFKKGTLQSYVLWPAKIDGIVTVESKGSASNPTKGTISFRVSK